MANERSGSERPERIEKGRQNGEKASPKHAEEQDSPEQERPPTPDELEGQSIEEMDEPPQAEGRR